MNVPDELVPRLKQLWNAGLSAIECGEELGLVGTPDQIRDAVIRAHQAPAKVIAKVNNHPDSNWTDERLATLTTMWNNGATAVEIAVKLGEGVSRNAVIGKAHRLGLKKPARQSVPSFRALRPKRTAAFRSNLPARYSAGEPEEDSRFAVDGLDGTPAPDDLAIPVEQRKTILKLTEKTCHWPVGDPGSGDFFFCGGATADGLPYCVHHARRAYAGRPTRRRDSDYRRTA